MTVLSFRLPEAEADELRRWADALGVDRSELIREALHTRLIRLRSEVEASRTQTIELTEDERSLAEVADWGPAEDWTDWHDAEG